MTTKTSSINRQTKTAVLEKIPYWLLLCLLFFILFLWLIANNGSYTKIFFALLQGVGTTIYVSFIAFSIALIFGFLLTLGRLSRNLIFKHAAQVYIEIIRGIPMLVLLYYIAFVGAPELVKLFNFLAFPLIKIGIFAQWNVRDLNFVWRAILALAIGYSAFIAEIFRAGIESVVVGQSEACYSLGLNRWQAMRLVILPQAFRNVLPPLCNDFVAIVKDSSLVSALGVQDITQIGKVYSASTFLFFETYNIVAFLYLVMTISLSLLIRFLEKHLKKHKNY